MALNQKFFLIARNFDVRVIIKVDLDGLPKATAAACQE